MKLRSTRPCTTHGDYMTFCRTRAKLLRRLAWIQGIPESHVVITPDNLAPICEWLQQTIAWEIKNSKLSRIQKWKNTMKTAVAQGGVGKTVYQFLKHRGQVVPPNLVTDANGNILYDPDRAMREIAEQWDSVFGVNVLAKDPMDALHNIWSDLSDRAIPCDLPPITAMDL